MKQSAIRYAKYLLCIVVGLFAFVGVMVLCSHGGLIAHAAGENENGVYFDVDKNPIESVWITTDDNLELRCGESASLCVEIYPENARLTMLDTSFHILDGSNIATVNNGELSIDFNAPIGEKVEVVASVDGVESKNSLVFTVVQTPVEEIVFLNDETEILIGGSLRLETQVIPENATNKFVAYSMISGGEYLQVSYNGILSYINNAVPDGDYNVTVRATSMSNPNVYVDKHIRLSRPKFETIVANTTLKWVEQQRSYSFNSLNDEFVSIFEGKATYYHIDVGEDVAQIDLNGLLTISSTAPIGSKITLTIDAIDGSIRYNQILEVIPVYATAFTPVILTEPSLWWNGVDYYLPGDSIQFDIASFEPANVSDCNKVCTLLINDESLASVYDGDTVVIKDVDSIKVNNPKITVTVYSAVNHLQASFDIMIYIPVTSIRAEANVSNLEGGVYSIDDILHYYYLPYNGMPRSINYCIDQADETIAVIRDDKLIIQSDLPRGMITISLFVDIDGIRSEIVIYTIYKATEHLELSAIVGGVSTSVHLPISSKDYADTVTLLTRVDETASMNSPDFIIGMGGEYIDGNIRFIGYVQDGLAQWEFDLKKNLSQHLTDADTLSPIIIYGQQDGVLSNIIEIEIHIPDEDLLARPSDVIRGSVNKIEFDHTKNATITAVEWKISNTTAKAGVYRLVNSTNEFFVPQNLSAGTEIVIEYRSADTEFFGDDGAWEMVTFTVAALNDFGVNNVYDSGNLKNGFNFVFGKDSAGVVIGKNNSMPQLWHGRSCVIELKYINDVISNYGMRIQDVKITGAAKEIVAQRTAYSICIFADENAKGNSEIIVDVIINDGNKDYVIRAATIYAFRQMSGQLAFDMITANKTSLINYINVNQSTFDFNANDGLSYLKFEVLNSDGGITVDSGGNLTIKSYVANKEQKVQYSFTQYYNNTALDTFTGVSNILLKTLTLDNDGGSSRDYIIALSGMDSNLTLQGYLPSKTGHNFMGYVSSGNPDDFVIDAKGNVLKDVSVYSSLKATWKPYQFYYYNLDACDKDCVAYALDYPAGPYDYGTIMTFTAHSWSGHEFKRWEVNGKEYSTDTKITYTFCPSQDGEIFWIDCCYTEPTCISSGTLITLADGTQKAVEYLDGTEQLLVWNFFTGSFDVAPILFIDSHGVKEYTVTRLHFSDGTMIEIIDEHGFWDCDDGQYVYLTRTNAEWYIGHRFSKHYTDSHGSLKNSVVSLIDVENVQTTTNAYSPVTYSHLCYYVNGMLSVPSETIGLVNYFVVDTTTMRFDQEKMLKDIEEYGLATYEDFATIVPEEIFRAFNGQYIKISMAKGLVTMEDLLRLAKKYSCYFEEGVQ